MTTTTSFLSLPPEIRNRIYMFALTPSGVLKYSENEPRSRQKSFFYVVQPGTHPNRHDQSTYGSEFNQLKYVNRKLHSETAGLELQYAPVLLFNGRLEPTQTGGAQALRFLTSVSPNRRAWLSHIGIYETPVTPDQTFLRDTSETLMLLDQICSKHTNLVVSYHPPAWIFRSDIQLINGCIFQGALYALVLRGDDTAPLFNPVSGFNMAELLDSDGERNMLPVTQARAWRVNNTVSLKATNFRFFPLVMDKTCVRSTGRMNLEKFYSKLWPCFSETAGYQLEQWCDTGL